MTPYEAGVLLHSACNADRTNPKLAVALWAQYGAWELTEEGKAYVALLAKIEQLEHLLLKDPASPEQIEEYTRLKATDPVAQFKQGMDDSIQREIEGKHGRVGGVALG